MLCRLNRLWISCRVDAGESLPARLQRHVDRCARCREHFHEQGRVAGLLSASAVTLRRGAPPFLHAGIMAAVRREANAPQTNNPFPRWSVAFSVAIVAAVAIWATGNLREPSPDRPSAPHVAANSASTVPEAVPGLPAMDLTSLGERLEQPFADEADALMTDARTALQLLAQNFMPSARDGEAHIEREQ